MFSPITEKFTKDPKYPWYEGFDEERMSYVDDGKNIVVHNSCINLSQEENSQYIPFEMERYYQGIDLTEMMLQIYFVNSDSHANYDTPINVTYSDYYIRFGWLVDKNATFVSGKLTFEIRAIGTIKDKDGNTYDYVWKTRPNSQINIEKSLHGHEVFTPDENWYHSLVKVINEKSEKVEDDMHEAQLSEQHAKTSETNAKTSENKAKTSETNAAASAAASEQSAKNSQTSAVNSESSATLSRSWAVGGTGVRADEATNNAKYWCETTDALLPEVREEIRLDKEDLKSETQRATAAENLITNNLNSEISRSTSAESALSDKIALEESRAKSAESALSDNLNTEKTRAESAEQAITNNLNTEVIRAKSAEESLSLNLSTTNTNLLNETKRAQDAEVALGDRITTVNTNLSTNLSTETARATNAETALSGRVTTNETKLSTLIGSDSDKSVRAIANEEIAAQLIDVSSSTSMDSLREIASWISKHPDDAATMNANINANANAISVNAAAINKNETDIASINSTLTTKANVADVNTALSAKADVSAMNSAVTEINTALNGKASNASVNSLSTAIDTLSVSVNAAVNSIADKVDVERVEALESSVAQMNSTLENKANTSDVSAALAKKSDTSHTHTYVHIGTTAPEDTSILWVDPVNGLKYYDGTAWKYVIFGTESI